MNKNKRISSADDHCECGTPPDLFNILDKQFLFTLDPCSSVKNHKCKKYYTRKDNGLIKSWQGEKVFMNPPYGIEIAEWVQKAYKESRKKCLIVALLPVRTDTRWFHDYIYKKSKIIFLKGRLTYINYNKSVKKYYRTAPFASMLVLWRKR